MIFYMEHDKEPGPAVAWIPCFFVTMSPDHFKRYKFKINNTVYKMHSEEFEEALQRDQMWDQLLYRPPDD